MWNHDKSFQHFIEMAAIGPLDVEIYKCSFDVLAEGFWDRKPVLQDNAEQSKLTALNNNSKNMKNSVHAPLSHDNGGLLRNTYLHLVRKKVAS